MSKELKYKVVSNPFPKDVEKAINKLSKEGYEIFDWKMNNNTICVILVKENN